MSDLKAIADALAARFVGITATNGSATESPALVTASLPNQMPGGVAVLVYHPSGVLDIATSRIRRDEHDFPIRVLRDPVDYPTRSDWLYSWFNATRDRVEMDMDLGLTYVAWARLVESRVEIEGQKYAGVAYDVVEYIVRVHINEIVTTMAV